MMNAVHAVCVSSFVTKIMLEVSGIKIKVYLQSRILFYFLIDCRYSLSRPKKVVHLGIRNCHSAANKYIDLPAKKKIIGPSLDSFFKDQFYVIPLIIMISTGIVYGTIYQRCSDDCM